MKTLVILLILIVIGSIYKPKEKVILNQYEPFKEIVLSDTTDTWIEQPNDESWKEVNYDYVKRKQITYGKD